MKLKLIMAMVNNEKSQAVIDAAREGELPEPVKDL